MYYDGNDDNTLFVYEYALCAGSSVKSNFRCILDERRGHPKGHSDAAEIEPSISQAGSTYKFEIFDSYGDGLCCGGAYGEGYVKLVMNGETIFEEQGNWGYDLSHEFTATVPAGAEIKITGRSGRSRVDRRGSRRHRLPSRPRSPAVSYTHLRAHETDS